jgi:nitrogen regulatory protein PII
MMQSSVEMKNSGLSGLQVCRALESCRPDVKFRQIIVPVDLTDSCPTSIDYAICFAMAFGSTVNLLHIYQEPYVVNQSSRSGCCDLFKEQRQKVFVDFYQLLRDTRNKYPDSIGYWVWQSWPWDWRDRWAIARRPHHCICASRQMAWTSFVRKTCGLDLGDLRDNPRGFDEMKKIEAIIVPGKLDAVCAELERQGINATLTLTDVRQAGERQASLSPHRDLPGALSDRLKVELIVGDRQVQRAADIITRYGQVALLRVNEALQIVPPLSNI